MNFSQSLALLDRLSIEQRGKRLEPIERAILSNAWENGCYWEIEDFQEQTVKNKAVKLWKYLSQLLNTKVNKSNLRQVLTELDSLPISPIVNVDRQRGARFYGRLTELWQLQSWIESEHRRLIWIYGMKGIGKTALVRKLAENLAPRLDRVVWISLDAAPQLIEVLAIVVKKLDGGRNAKLSMNLQIAIDKTIGYLQANRCLLVFDNADLVLSHAGSNPDLFPDYVQFFDRLNSLDGNICCLTISTEKCAYIGSDYRQLELQGLDRLSCQDLLHASELVGTIAEWDTLTDRYQGNPQYLKIAASTISDIFAGKIAKFLDASILVYQPIETLLDRQFDLLSNAEISILLWLAIVLPRGASEIEPVDLAQLQLLTSVSISNSDTVKILDRLVRKHLVEVHDDLFTLPESILEYVTNRYYELVCEEITTKKLKILHLHPIIPLVKMLKNNGDYVKNKIREFRQDPKYHLSSIIAKLLSRENFTPCRSEILALMLSPPLQQRMKLKQDLKAELSDILMQLAPLEYKYAYYLKTQLSSSDRSERGKMPSYAAENITNLLDGIDREL